MLRFWDIRSCNKVLILSLRFYTVFGIHWVNACVKLDPGAHVFYAFGFALKSECDKIWMPLPSQGFKHRRVGSITSINLTKWSLAFMFLFLITIMSTKSHMWTCFSHCLTMQELLNFIFFLVLDIMIRYTGAVKNKFTCYDYLHLY
jgi:hypothetical protein